VSYRDDDAARAARATALIDEIAQLEKQKLGFASIDEKLDSARRELSAMQASPPPPEPRPGALTHVVVFAMSAATAFVGYTLLF